MNPLAPLVACLLALSVAASPAQASEPATIPCSDPRGCPDLLVDGLHLLAGTQTLEAFQEDSCPVQEGTTEAGLRQLMRFTYTSPNLGLGDLIVGSPADHPEWFEYHACHDHWHYKDYADYRLWTPEAYEAWNGIREGDPSLSAQEALAAHPELLDGLVTGEKRGFCVIDIAPAGPHPQHAPVVPDPEGKYVSCSDGQGISVGWADTYELLLDGQWIDVTGVAAGAYVLEAEVNAEHVYEEMDYANNRAAVPTAVLPGPSNTPALAPVGSLSTRSATTSPAATRSATPSACPTRPAPTPQASCCTPKPRSTTAAARRAWPWTPGSARSATTSR